ncbi:hypothetical protein B0H19DRAFT_1074287 [Mycena capillaripes]|nr:hypothetical protein B0H19DRAFT_1074287 [Mycena capillaripes]
MPSLATAYPENSSATTSSYKLASIPHLAERGMNSELQGERVTAKVKSLHVIGQIGHEIGVFHGSIRTTGNGYKMQRVKKIEDLSAVLPANVAEGTDGMDASAAAKKAAATRNSASVSKQNAKDVKPPRDFLAIPGTSVSVDIGRLFSLP